MDESRDEDRFEIEQPVAGRRPTWGDRLDDFLIYMSKATAIKIVLTFAVLVPILVIHRAREKEEQAQRRHEREIEEARQVLRERMQSGNAADVDLRLLGISPEEHEPIRAQGDGQAERPDEAPVDAPPPRPDF